MSDSSQPQQDEGTGRFALWVVAGVVLLFVLPIVLKSLGLLPERI